MEFKEYKLTSQDFYKSENLIPDAVLDSEDPINDLKRLAGLTDLNQGRLQEYQGDAEQISNISHTAQEKIDYQKKHNIRPGTPEWFRLWFALPLMTNEKPF